MFNLPVVYGSFPFDLDTIYLVLVHINSTSGLKDASNLAMGFRGRGHRRPYRK